MGQQPPKPGAAVDPPLALAPLRGAVLVGGASRRMGRPKEALEVGGERLLDRIVAALAAAGCGPAVLIGAGRAVGGPAAALPRLADAAGVEGPLAGLLAALRSERAAWVVAACDLPRISRPAVEWLVAQREAARARGCWAVLPRAGGRVQPLLALYEPESRALVEELATSGKPSPSRLAGHARVWSPEPPASLAAAWSNANTPGELEALLGASE
jgi:molybdopterin-guanine dinucleotide biosynthesis protein A